MNSLEEKINHLLSPVALEGGYGIVDIKVINENRVILQIMLERIDGKPISIGDCTNFSRQSAVILDVEDPLSNRYNLEVSSAGINRPLVKLQDFDKFKNQEVIIKTKIAIDGRKNFSGVLLGIKDEVIELEVDGTTIYIDFAIISKANLDIIKDTNINIKGMKGTNAKNK